MEFCPQFIVLGDSRQSIYEYKNSSRYFLEKADKIFSFKSSSIFKELSLKISYRLTKPMAGFINDCLVGEIVVESVKEGPKVRYLCCDVFNTAIEEVDYYMKVLKQKEEDIFILAPSLKSENKDNPVNRLADKLTQNRGVKIFVPPSDDYHAEESEINGKICFLSFHQSKGLERKTVIVFSFDKKYFKYNGKGLDPNFLPNPLYVAVTRAKKYLTVLHNSTNRYFPFININMLSKWCHVIGSPKIDNKKKEKSSEIPKTVTAVMRQLPEDLVRKCLEKLHKRVVLRGGKEDYIPIKTSIKADNNTTEGVAEITGLAVPAYFELNLTKQMTIVKIINEKKGQEPQEISGKNNKNDKKVNLKDLIKKSSTNIIDYDVFIKIISEDNPIPILERVQLKNKCDYLLIMATIYQGFASGFSHKNNQIQVYDWLSKAQLELLVQRMEKAMPSLKNLQFEKVLSGDYPAIGENSDCVILSGRADIVCEDQKEIWEIKCCTETSDSHLIQVALYMHLYFKQYRKKITGKLFNITTNDIIEVSANEETLKEIVVNILEYHLNNSNNRLSISDFLKKCRAVQKKYRFLKRERFN